MDLNFVTADTRDFDPRTYLSVLVAIAKADKDNAQPEYNYVHRQADHLGLDANYFFRNIDQHFLLEKRKVTRLTAMVILKDAIMLASLDRNFSLPERNKVYTYAESLDVSRTDVDALVELINEYRRLNQRWQQLVNR
jgi:uncharacterized tellurite resistance protein B-like protein